MQEDPNQAPQPDSTTQSPYALESSAVSGQTTQNVHDTITWTASEYILHEKTGSWYLALVLVTAMIAVVLFLITKDVTVVGLALVCGFVFGFYGTRKPKQVSYGLSDKDLVIDSKHYAFREFKSFSVVPEGAFSSIVLWPHKRFAQFTTIYYPLEYEEQITQAIGSHLPLEQHNLDFVEKLARHVRF